ncbi:hypothetical protein SB861_68175, partial [Paraburkholderia sp. SIMBA_049]
MDLMFRDALVEELSEIAPAVAAACTVIQGGLNALHKAVLLAAAGKLEWSEIPKLSADPRSELA